MIYIFLIYNHSKQQKTRSIMQRVYLYPVIPSIFILSLYLPQLHQISLGNNSLKKTSSISLQSTFPFSLFQFLDVPFNNGHYSIVSDNENKTFHKITSPSSITSDPSRPFIPNFTHSITVPQKHHSHYPSSIEIQIYHFYQCLFNYPQSSQSQF